MTTTSDPGRYARAEHERRFLLSGVPDGLGPARRITDRYLEGTLLRLRTVVAPDGGVTRKLGHKVRARPDDPALVWHTSLYLDAAEADRLAGLPGHDLVKDRHDWPAWGGAVDVFTGALAGLVLAEMEVGDAATVAAVPAPPGHRGEVTADDRFSGGRLCRLDAAGLRALLAGVTPG